MAEAEEAGWLSSALYTLLFAWLVYYTFSVAASFAHSDLTLARERRKGGSGDGGEEEEEGEGAAPEDRSRDEDSVVLRGDSVSTAEHAAHIPAPLVSNISGPEPDSSVKGGQVHSTDSAAKAREIVSGSAAKSRPNEGDSREEDVNERGGRGGEHGSTSTGREQGKTLKREGKELEEKKKDGGQKGEDKAEEEDEDGWESVEVEETALEHTFHAAASLVVMHASSASSPPIGEGLQLLLYALYKQATDGPCCAPQPAFYNLKARAKWDAWSKLGNMGKEEAMEKYVELVTQIYPSFRPQDKDDELGSGGGAEQGQGARGGGGGRSVSTLQHAEGEEAEGTPAERDWTRLFEFASNGDEAEVVAELKSHISLINATDDEGRTALHWAVDRGHAAVAATLIHLGADIDSQDHEGQTPLHYAAVCEHKDLARLLLAKGANAALTDGDGQPAKGLFPSSWGL